MTGMEILRLVLDAASIGMMATGMVFVLAGALGVLRLPDFFTRMHAAGVTDTLGAELIIFGLILQSGFTLLSAKLLLVGFILFLTSPTATHAVANAAHRAGQKPLLSRHHPAHPRDRVEQGGE
ncbi:monovalent cation/H(+) antiporter subunit G [Hyphobacterium marinum]|uniref:Monovalent cation/H(+) antiporter subunit G n=1 Tax=Hyphobacterium marinum TaxID=3116574 RepID=A0ABU7M0L8_9PROT|nr:monovalent cation/H(+) antiporter subunit G [Hyphobacterium sp. Y6023]MEE2567363.1 monovalent cation/H(+) antiporter subunit G [Hyphobacterium sp. Y6023]